MAQEVLNMKKLLKIFTSLLVIGLMIFQVSISSIADDQNKNTSNRFNVVYVLDNSGSMEETDPDNMRYAAVSLFNSLLANDGNFVGGVVFSDSVKMQHSVQEVTSASDKRNLMNKITSTEIKGWTNIGQALLTAEDMLAENGNCDQDSVILLLTDGNTEMGTKDETNTSLENKAAAIQIARDKGIRIYSICLNADGINSNTLNPQEMQQIADATGGGYIEVTSDDLTDAFKKFYEMIYSTNAKVIINGTLNADGVLSKDFDIPAAGVEEVNIIIDSEQSLSEIKLTQPDGTVLEGSKIDDIMIVSDSYSVIKIMLPQGGKWNIYAKGSPNTSINISMMFNASLSVSAGIENLQETYEIGDKLRLKTVLTTSGTVATNPDVVKDYKINAIVTDQNGNKKEIPVVFDNGELVTDYTVEDYGTYSFCVTAEGNGISVQSDTTEIYVGNTPPVLEKESLSAIGYIWPFIDLDCSVKLSDAVNDKEDKDLTYTIDSTSFLDESYTLDGDVLSMKDFDISKGSFTVRATDSMGASVTFEVYMTSRNVPLYVAIGLGIVAFLILATILIKLYRDHGRYFKGTINVTVIRADGSEQTEIRQPKRGRYRLSSFGIASISGMNFRKMYFQATGKDYVKLRSKKAFKSITSTKPIKKLKVDMIQKSIFADQNSGESVVVQFSAERL